MAWWRFPVAGGGSRIGLGQADEEVERPAVTVDGILSESCTFRAPATLFERNGQEICRVRFAGLSERELVLDLPSERRVRQLRPPAACSALLSHRDCALTFVARVLRLDDAGTPEHPRQIVLSRPQTLAGADLRTAPRVRGASGLKLELRARDEEPVPALLLDLSTTGALIELPEKTRGLSTPELPTPDLPLGSELKLTLQLEGQTASLTGRVRRREGSRAGILFPEALRAGEPAPPPALAALVARLAALSQQTPKPRAARGELAETSRPAAAPDFPG